MRTSDALLQSAEFRAHAAEAVDHANAHGLESWAARVVWVALRYNTPIARRFAMRRSNFRQSRAWIAYQNLLNAGIFSEDPAGIAWNEDTEPWESDPILWFDDLCRIAAGGETPEGFPNLLPPRPPPPA